MKKDLPSNSARLFNVLRTFYIGGNFQQKDGPMDFSWCGFSASSFSHHSVSKAVHFHCFFHIRVHIVAFSYGLRSLFFCTPLLVLLPLRGYSKETGKGIISKVLHEKHCVLSGHGYTPVFPAGFLFSVCWVYHKLMVTI